MMNELYKLLGVNRIVVGLYGPQGNGLCERMNRALIQNLTILTGPDVQTWDEQIYFALFAMRTTKSGMMGETAYQMCYAMDPLLPVDQAFGFRRSPYVTQEDYSYPEQVMARLTAAWNNPAVRVSNAQESKRKQHDKHATDLQVQPGDQVLLKQMRCSGVNSKLDFRYEVKRVIRGTLYVVPITDPQAVPIRILQRNTMFHKANVVVPDIETESDVDDNDGDAIAEEGEPILNEMVLEEEADE